MDIGTAKPSMAERKRVVHHLVDVAAPSDTWNLGGFKEATTAIINDINRRNKIPLLVGGTGQFVRAITEGWVVPEVKPDTILREVLMKWSEQIGAMGLHARLNSIDPQAAKNMEPNNVRRVIRALEVIFHTGKRFSEMRTHESVPFHVLQVGLTRPREELYRRIDDRVDAMIKAGFVNEVQQLLDNGYSPDLPSMSAIGYRQMVSFLNGDSSLEEAVILIKRMSRKFVRRQANWFKLDDSNIHWFDVSQDVLPEIEELVLNFIEGTNNT
jgi:tRNA dimethylallyltransferase